MSNVFPFISGLFTANATNSARSCRNEEQTSIFKLMPPTWDTRRGLQYQQISQHNSNLECSGVFGYFWFEGSAELDWPTCRRHRNINRNQRLENRSNNQRSQQTKGLKYSDWFINIHSAIWLSFKYSEFAIFPAINWQSWSIRWTTD